MPTPDKVSEYTHMISNKYPSLTNVWGGGMDGLKVMVEAAGKDVVKNMLYNGWRCNHYISNFFLFSAAGKICMVYFKACSLA